MASLTLKNLTPDLLERLHARAAAENRSLNREVIHLLELALAGGLGEGSRRHRQIEAWRVLAGRWSSDLAAEEEAAAILDARTPGREPST
jgi:plasmid stability protein